MGETWYVLTDGSAVDPSECAPDEAGTMRHKNGKEVAVRGDAYSSRCVDADAERAKAKKPEPAPDAKEMKPEPPKRAYKTREMKAKD